MAEGKKGRPKGKRRERKVVSEGRAYIYSSFNNVIVTLTDRSGNVIAWGSSGTGGFKGSRKGTPYAAQLAAEGAAKRARGRGARRGAVYVRGRGRGRGG